MYLYIVGSVVISASTVSESSFKRAAREPSSPTCILHGHSCLEDHRIGSRHPAAQHSIMSCTLRISYMLLKKLASLISFRLAPLILCVNSLLFCAYSIAPSSPLVKSLLCSCIGTGLSMPSLSFACLRSYLARIFLVIAFKSTPPSMFDFGAFGSATRFQSQEGYSVSSSARSGFEGCLT